MQGVPSQISGLFRRHARRTVGLPPMGGPVGRPTRSSTPWRTPSEAILWAVIHPADQVVAVLRGWEYQGAALLQLEADGLPSARCSSSGGPWGGPEADLRRAVRWSGPFVGGRWRWRRAAVARLRASIAKASARALRRSRHSLFARSVQSTALESCASLC